MEADGVRVRVGVPVTAEAAAGAAARTERERRARVRGDARQRTVARARPDVNYYESSDSDIESSSDSGEVAIGDGVHFVLLRNHRRLAGTGFVSPDIVPPQDTDPTTVCGGTWRLDDTDGKWRLVDDLSESALLTVQMRLGDMERRPSPVPGASAQAFVANDDMPPAPPRRQQQQQEHRYAPASRQDARTVPKCSVCHGAYVAVVFRNCGHLCVCGECRAQLVLRSRTGNRIRCPMCRVDGGTIEVFM